MNQLTLSTKSSGDWLYQDSCQGNIISGQANSAPYTPNTVNTVLASPGQFASSQRPMHPSNQSCFNSYYSRF